MFFVHFCRWKETEKMREEIYYEDQNLDVMDDAPTTSEEAHRRIVEAERGIANGEVVLHSEVMKHSYALLVKYAG